MQTRKPLLAAFIWAAMSLPAAAQSIRALNGRTLLPAAIASEIETRMRANAVTGLAVALIRDGKVVYLRGFGLRDVTRALPLTPDTIMHGASLTKATFAYMVMQLVDEGRIKLDRPIADYLPQPLPDYPPYADLAGDQHWQKLTFRILLDHTTGLANYRSFEDDGKLRFHWTPGTRYGYSGEGLNLAQFVLEKGLKLDVQVEMQRRVFDRFGMVRTSLTWRQDLVPNEAQGYSEDGALIPREHHVSVHAASSMDTTLRDWSLFLTGVVRGDGLSARAEAEMIRLQIPIKSAVQFPTLTSNVTHAYRSIRLGYGLGWGVFDTPYGRAFFKEGHDNGVGNYALCVEPRRACILLLSNSGRAEGIIKSLVDDLMGDVGLPWRWEGYIPHDMQPIPHE